MFPHPFDILPARHRIPASYRSGQSIFRQGDSPDAIYYLESGTVHLTRYTEAGEAVIIHRAMRGETFAEASLFSEQYHCDALAVSDIDLIALNKQSILRAMQINQKFALLLTERFARQVQTNRQRLEIQAIRAADMRVHSAILAGILRGDILSFAGEIGLTPEATYRALRKLVQNGKLIKQARGKYVLPNR